MKTFFYPFRALPVIAVACLSLNRISAQSIWNGTNNVSVSTNWSDAANWLPGGVPGAAANIKFYDNAAETTVAVVNNVVDSSITNATVQYGNTNGFHSTLINAGQTLTVTGGLTVGTETDNGNAQQVNTTISGPATLNLTGGTLQIRQTTSTAAGSGGLRGTLDLSGLDTFTGSITAVSVGIQLASTTHTRATGTLLLAKTNQIALSGAFQVGNDTSNPGGANFAYLGQTNVISGNTINIGRRKTAATLQFNSAFASPVARFRGSDGVSRVTAWNIGDNSEETGTTGNSATGTCDFSLGTVDALIATMQVGRSKNGTATGAGNGTGTLTFNTGAVDVNTLEIGFQGGANASAGIGTVNANGGTLTVNNTLRLGFTSGSTGAANTKGTLNINGGTVRANTIVNGGSTISELNITSGNLTVTNTIGSISSPIASVSLSDANLTIPAVAIGNTTAVATALTTGGSGNTINVSVVPAVAIYPSQFPLVSYTGGIGGAGYNFALGAPLPGGFQGYLSNNVGALTIDLVVTNGPAPAKAIVWNGLPNGDWNTSNTNWQSGGLATNFNQNDFVTFDDTANGTTTVNLTTALTPSSMTVSNTAKNYTFSGTGGIGGTTGLTKEGAGSLTIANSGANSFSGIIALNAGSLVFNRTDTFTVPNLINGAGALSKIGSGTLTLSGLNTYAGGTTLNAGTTRLTSVSAAGTAAIAVNAATLVAGAAHTNSITLANATMGGLSGITALNGGLTAQNATTNTIYISDPQNLAVNAEMNFTGVLAGGGNINVMAGTNNPNPDGGVGFRLRATTDGGYSGTITFSNGVKAEVQTTQAGPFSPAGTGKFVIYGGTIDGSNTLNGTYSEFNVRDNFGGDTTFGNDVQLAGSGLAILNPLGTAPVGATVTMGNLRIGSGQNLGVHLNSGNAHVVAFPTVTLTGGTATFTPGIPAFGATNAVGSDLSLGDISQSVGGSGFVMNGFRTLIITGTGAHTGPTTVSNGTLRLSGSLTSSSVTVAGGRLTGNGSASGNVIVQPNGTISPGDSPGIFTVGGTLTLQGTTLMEISPIGPVNDVIQGGSIIFGGTLLVTNISGTTLVGGETFDLFNGTLSSSFANLQLPGLGFGLSWNTSQLGVNGTLSVSGSIVPPTISTVSNSGASVTLTGTHGVTNGTFYVLSSTDLTLPVDFWSPVATNTFNGSGNFNVTVPVTPGEPERYFMIRLP
jgi:fibronectin-binding autotransporter adhesin